MERVAVLMIMMAQIRTFDLIMRPGAGVLFLVIDTFGLIFLSLFLVEFLFLFLVIDFFLGVSTCFSPLMPELDRHL